MFASKVVAVTGSSGGIGAALAVRFAAEGADGLVIHGRNESALQKVQERCAKANGKTKILLCVGDIGKEDVRKSLVDETIKRFGKLDVLVNNAGIWDIANFTNSSMDLYDKLFEVNVRSLIALTKVAAPHLVDSKGNIVNISSEMAKLAHEVSFFYNLTKATVDHFTKCLAAELGPKGVRVNSVSPGYIPDTDVLSRAGVTGGSQQDFVKIKSQAYPLRRTGTPEEVCDAVTFIASDKAKFITGAILPVDGGGAM